MARFEVHPELERQTVAALIVYFIVFICLRLSIQLKRRLILYVFHLNRGETISVPDYCLLHYIVGLDSTRSLK
jgi:hypothetical protein